MSVDLKIEKKERRLKGSGVVGVLMSERSAGIVIMRDD